MSWFTWISTTFSILYGLLSLHVICVNCGPSHHLPVGAGSSSASVPSTVLAEVVNDCELVADEGGWLGFDLALQESKAAYDAKVQQVQGLAAAIANLGLSLQDVPGDGRLQGRTSQKSLEALRCGMPLDP